MLQRRDNDSQRELAMYPFTKHISGGVPAREKLYYGL